MPMIAHQRISAISPAPLYSAASARVNSMYDDEFESPAMMEPRSSHKYKNSFMEDSVNSAMQVRGARRTLQSALVIAFERGLLVHSPSDVNERKPIKVTKLRMSPAFNTRSALNFHEVSGVKPNNFPLF